MGQLRLDGTPLFGGQLKWSASGYYQRANEQFQDLEGEISPVAQDTDNTINAYGGGARAKWFLPWAPLALEADGTATTEQFHPVGKVPAYTEGPSRWRRATTLALGTDAYLLRQKLVLTATIRYEQHVDEFGDAATYAWLPPSPEGRYGHDARSPSLGARWQALSWLTVKTNAGRYYRLPTFLELFGNVGSVTGNAELAPESGVNRDIGAVVSLPRAGLARSLLIEVSYFDNDVDDLILFFPNSQQTSKPTNIGAARLRGWEMSAHAMLRENTELTASYTYLDAEDTSDIPYYRGNALPSRPAHDVGASLSHTWRALRATYEGHYLSANYLDRANLRETPARGLHALALSWRTPIEGVSLTLEGRNLTDERAVDVAGFPLPGRSVYSTLGYRY
jgi:iron complex outermembrane receptor protein